MSQPRSFRNKGAGKGPYGPSNPAPPPFGSPPRKRGREAGSATIQESTEYYNHSRIRSRSPARNEHYNERPRYRDRPMGRQDRGQQALASVPPRNDDRQAPNEARSKWRANKRADSWMSSQHLRSRSQDEAGHAQSRHDQSPVRRSGWQVEQDRGGNSAPARAGYNHSYSDRYGIDRDVPGQRRDDWQRAPSPDRDDYPAQSPVVDVNGSNTYDHAHIEAAPSTAHIHRDLDMEDEVDWDDEAIAVADAVPSAAPLGTTKKPTKMQPPRKAPWNQQGKQRGGRLTKEPSRTFGRVR